VKRWWSFTPNFGALSSKQRACTEGKTAAGRGVCLVKACSELLHVTMSVRQLRLVSKSLMLLLRC